MLHNEPSRLADDSTFSLGTRIFDKLAGRTLSKDDVDVEGRLSLCYVRSNDYGNVDLVFGSSGLNRNIDRVTIRHKTGIFYSSYRC